VAFHFSRHRPEPGLQGRRLGPADSIYMTPATYIALATVLAVTAVAFLAGSVIEKPRNKRGTRLRRWLRFHETLK